jgi:hypothetical protein
MTKAGGVGFLSGFERSGGLVCRLDIPGLLKMISNGGQNLGNRLGLEAVNDEVLSEVITKAHGWLGRKDVKRESERL